MANRFSLSLLSVALAGCLTLAGCANPREDAGKLSKSGIEISDTLNTKIGQTASRIEGTIELDCISLMARGFTEADCETFAAEAKKPVFSLADAVRARQKAVKDLKASYEALAEISEADRGDAWKAQTDKLLKSVNGYLAALGLSALAETAIAPIGKIISLFGDAQQRKDILEANQKIKDAVDGLARGMETERANFVAIRSDIASSERTARNLLMDKRILSRSAVFKPVADGLGATVRADADEAIDAAPALQRLAKRQNEKNVDAALELEAKAYDASLAALKQLSAKHEELAAGAERISLSSLLAQADELADIIKDIRAVNGAE